MHLPPDLNAAARGALLDPPGQALFLGVAGAQRFSFLQHLSGGDEHARAQQASVRLDQKVGGSSGASRRREVIGVSHVVELGVEKLHGLMGRRKCGIARCRLAQFSAIVTLKTQLGLRERVVDAKVAQRLLDGVGAAIAVPAKEVTKWTSASLRSAVIKIGRVKVKTT